MLSDRNILEEVKDGSIVIDPFDATHLQPASYDVHLDDKLLVPPNQSSRYVDYGSTYGVAIDAGIMCDPAVGLEPLESRNLPNRYENDTYWLPPGGVALGSTQELLTLNPDASLAADIAGCSSLGRWWLFVHVTAGFIDPGWSGRLTLELYNASPWWLRLWAGMRIAQLRFYYTYGVPTRSYLDTGHYAGAITALPSAYKG